MTSIEKRKALVEIASAYGNKKIHEEGKDNYGPLLQKYVESYSSYKQGNPWCAGFVSAMAGIVDSKFPEEPKRKYNSMSSSHTGAGIFSTNYKDAKPGLCVFWKNGPNSEGTGHAGIIIEVTNAGVKTAEGNTGTSKNYPNEQVREGYETNIKFYSWEKFLNPASDRKFCFVCKIWDEEDPPIRDLSKFPTSQMVEPSSLPDDTNSGTSDSSVSQKPRQDLSKLIIDMSGLPDTALELKPTAKISENTSNVTDKTSKEHEPKQIINSNVSYIEPTIQNKVNE
jgi:hypothetical protein